MKLRRKKMKSNKKIKEIIVKKKESVKKVNDVNKSNIEIHKKAKKRKQ